MVPPLRPQAAATSKAGRPAVLDNYRLGFPIFSEYWGGGIADIVYDPGKYVSGALFDLPGVRTGRARPEGRPQARRGGQGSRRLQADPR